MLKIDIVGLNVLNRIHCGCTQEVTLCLKFIYDFCVQKRMLVDCKNLRKHLHMGVLFTFANKIGTALYICAYECFECRGKYTLKRGSSKNTRANEANGMSQKTNFLD